MQAATSQEQLTRRFVLILLLLNLSVPVWVLVQHSFGEFDNWVYIFSGWASVLLLNPALFIGINRAYKKLGEKVPPRLVSIAAALALVSGLITTIAVSVATRQNDYLKLAQSNIPLSRIQPERTRLVVALIRRDAADSQKNTQDAKSMKPISPALYSVDSFATKDTMESVASQLQHAYELDQSYVSAKNQAMKDFRDQMASVDANYLRSFDAQMKESEAADAAIEDSEQKWVTATLNLYSYAQVHANGISLRSDGHLVIADPKVRDQILQQIDACRKLQEIMSSEHDKAADDHRKVQQALGGKPSD